tara:strand:+ start:466 stop:726 length:261 start_codon:yes stop_codon:yes gene_type:complete
MKFFYIPLWFADIIALMGVLWLCKGILWLLQNILSLYYHKETYKNPTELRYFLLRQENMKLKAELSKVQQENDEIVSSIISQINKN